MAVVSAIQAGGTPERAAVEQLAGPLGAKLSDAQTISTLIALGIAQVRDAVLDAHYAVYAAEMDDEDREVTQTLRGRRTRLAN
jgi:hypothetical protein